MKIHRTQIVISMFLVSLLGCSARPIKSTADLLRSDSARPSEISSRESVESGSSSVGELRKLNKEAGSPTFGLIKGFYQLPQTRPAGAVSITEGYVFGAPYRSFWLQENSSSPYAVLPASAEESQALENSLNKMLDAGVHFREISMADAIKVMKVERRMMEKKKVWYLPSDLASGVDILISWQKGMGTSGPILVGRAIDTKEGRLLALATFPNIGVYALSPLIEKLAGDALRRLGEKNLR